MDMNMRPHNQLGSKWAPQCGAVSTGGPDLRMSGPQAALKKSVSYSLVRDTDTSVLLEVILRLWQKLGNIRR